MAAIDDIAVLTSENVRLTYTLAGVGTRLTAFILDALIVGAAQSLVTLAFVLMGMDLRDLDFRATGSMAFSVLAAIYIFVSATLIWGYWFLFEWANWGQTPGKAALGLRVADEEGGPADLVACAVRNVIRIVDLVLAAFGITLFVVIFTPKYQRLGDIAAGTVVVRTRRLTFDEVMAAAERASSGHEAVLRPAAGAGLKLTDSEVPVVSRFLERKDMLPGEVRASLARELAARVRARAPEGLTSELSDEQLLELALNQSRG